MEFNGEIVFGIADANPIEVDFGADILPTKTIDKELEQMTQQKELWNDEALLNSVEWENCRKMGKDLLET